MENKMQCHHTPIDRKLMMNIKRKDIIPQFFVIRKFDDKIPE